MKIIDANGSLLTPKIVKEAMSVLAKVDPKLKRIVRMPIEQYESGGEFRWGCQEFALEHAALSKTLKDVLLIERKCGGWPIKVDAWMLKDRIRFEVEGLEVLGIVNLGDPILREV